MSEVFTPEELAGAESFYLARLEEIKGVLECYAEKKTRNRYGYYGVSDDGFWDLRAHIIGLGENFYLSVISDPEKARKISDDRSYVENFGYIFH